MLFKRKDLILIILPLFVEQLLTVTIGMFDSMMVSSVGEAAVSGVSLVDSINLLIFYVFSALATGGAVICSQYMGAKHYDEARRSAKQLIWSIFLVSSFLMLITLFARGPLLKLIFGKIEPDVMRNAEIYFLITALSFPFLAIYNGSAALFRSMGNSSYSMLANIIMNIINVSGNALLIYKYNMGVAGAAIATLFSRIIGAILMMVLLRNKERPIYLEKIFRFRPDFKIIKKILGIGIPSGMENGMFQFGKLITQSLVAICGTAAIAANAVANTLSQFEYAIGSAISLAMITIIGHCIGAGEFEQAKKYTLKLLKIEYLFIALIAAGFTIFAKPLIGVYNLSCEGSEIAYQLMILNNIFVVTVWPMSFTLPNSFRAASDVKYPMIISIVSMWVFRVGFSYIFSLWMGMGVFGVWLAMMTDWTFRAIIYTIHFIKEKWLLKYKGV